MDSHDIGPDEIHLRELGRRDSNSVKDWKVCGREVPRSEIVFFSQVIINYIVVFLCRFNLTTGRGDLNLLRALLSGCMGYLLPNPIFKKWVRFISRYRANSSMNTLPENTLTQYVTKLPDRFDLGEWEVVLSEIKYPISWYNVSKEDVQLEMYHVDSPLSSCNA